jgi:hypothetical protein
MKFTLSELGPKLYFSRNGDLSEINAFYRRPNFTPLISAENALLITAPSLQFQLLQFVTFGGKYTIQ